MKQIDPRILSLTTLGAAKLEAIEIASHPDPDVTEERREAARDTISAVDAELDARMAWAAEARKANARCGMPVASSLGLVDCRLTEGHAGTHRA